MNQLYWNVQLFVGHYTRVRKEEAEAHLAEVKALDAQLDLLKKLKEMGVAICQDENVNIVVVPTPRKFDLMKLANELRSDESSNSK